MDYSHDISHRYTLWLLLLEHGASANLEEDLRVLNDLHVRTFSAEQQLLTTGTISSKLKLPVILRSFSSQGSPASGFSSGTVDGKISRSHWRI